MTKNLLAFSAFVLSACASGPCPQQARTGEQPPAAIASAATSSAPETKAVAKIRIFKADGSKQCEKSKSIELKTAEAELKKAGVAVLSSSKQPDGMMHTQMCGSPTGMANTFEINSSDLAKAQKLGFSRFEN